MSVAQRRHPRIGPVLVRSQCRFGERSWDAFLTSISEGGGYLVTDELVPERARLSLRFVLPWQSRRLAVEAEVVYAISESDVRPDGYPAGVGLAFLLVDSGQRDALRTYVERFRGLAQQLSDPE